MWISNLQPLEFPPQIYVFDYAYTVWINYLNIPALIRQYVHLKSNAFAYQTTESLVYALHHFTTHIHSITEAFTYQMTISLTNALSHFPAHSLNYSPSHSLTKSPNRSLTLSVTSSRTHLITVSRIHLPNDHVAYLTLSVTSSHTHLITVTRIHLRSTHVHTSLLSTPITCTSKPLILLPTHKRSTSDPSSCSGTHFLACSNTMPLSHRFTCSSSHSVTKSHYTQTDSRSPNAPGCDNVHSVKYL